MNIEHHPLKPFLSPESKLLILGSFPPPKERWSMDFFYPNLQNDMWRIFGLVFFNDRNHFIVKDQKLFDMQKIQLFLNEKGVSIYDVAVSVIRHKGNASDNSLEIIEMTNIKSLLRQIPLCNSIVTTGQKASDALASLMEINPPKIGDYNEFIFDDRVMRFFRMPSSSRAYPLALIKKADIYKTMFTRLNLL